MLLKNRRVHDSGYRRSGENRGIMALRRRRGGNSPGGGGGGGGGGLGLGEGVRV